MSDVEEATRRRYTVARYRKKLLEHKELEGAVRIGQSHTPYFPYPNTIPFNIRIDVFVDAFFHLNIRYGHRFLLLPMFFAEVIVLGALRCSVFVVVEVR